MTFLKKNGGVSKLGASKLGGPKKLGGLKTKETATEEKAEELTAEKPKLGSKKLGGGLKKKTLGAKKPIDLDEEPKEETKTELTEEELIAKQEDEAAEAMLGASEEEIKEYQESLDEEAKEEEKKEEPKPKKTIGKKTVGKKTTKEETEETAKEEEEVEEKPKKKVTTSKAKKKAEEKIVKDLEVDESKRVTIEEMDEIMRPIVAPTTEVWEQEKKDVLEALNNIKVEQDMEMPQVKACLADLDELNFEVLPKLHDAETMYDGTKQNFDTVKAVAIANGSGGNAESRKAEGILACKNFVAPNGAVVDLQQYMLLIEERYKFYQKIADGINFKKYSLVNYNNALKVESKNA